MALQALKKAVRYKRKCHINVSLLHKAVCRMSANAARHCLQDVCKLCTQISTVCLQVTVLHKAVCRMSANPAQSYLQDACQCCTKLSAAPTAEEFSVQITDLNHHQKEQK
jgi:hypothetical protein